MSFFFKAVCVNCLVRAGMAGHTYSQIFLVLVQCSAAQRNRQRRCFAFHMACFRFLSIFFLYFPFLFPPRETFLCIENKFVVDNQTSRF